MSLASLLVIPGCKVRDVTSVVRCQPQEGPHIFHSARCGPVLQGITFHLLDFDSFTQHVVS